MDGTDRYPIPAALARRPGQACRDKIEEGKNPGIIIDFWLSTCVVICYIEGRNCTLDYFRTLAAGEWVVHQELTQTDMAKAPENFAETVKAVRRQLGISQEELAHELGVSFSTINRWENAKTVPFKLARRQFEAFCKRMAGRGKLNLDNKEMHP
jgi:putative transcriptional regulator